MPGYQDTGLIVAGDVFMGEVDASGNVGALRGPLNVPSLTITPNTVETIERQSYKKSTYGQTLDAVNLPNEAANLTIQFDSLPAIQLAEALAGKTAVIDVAADTVTGEAHTLQEGLWIKLASGNLVEGSVTVTETASSGDITADCEIDHDAGLVKANTAAAATDVTIDYDTNATSGTRVLGASEISKPRYILVQGINLATNRKVRVEIDRTVLSSDQATELMGREFITGQLTGSLVTLEGKDSPYTMDMLDD
ncbi:hypothetical protein [Halomonas sp. SL1]|uniref:phage tail tube protein n=1 Tax=Halomonas sp. SL1 TaxID=2137478 RepID=UPI000D15ED3E|nr:hypothetical protein [Halomonas sp. SL1]RAH37411.1 hypothetical protein C9J49_010945 [Halomonas sp. SL1]